MNENTISLIENFISEKYMVFQKEKKNIKIKNATYKPVFTADLTEHISRYQDWKLKLLDRNNEQTRPQPNM